MTILVAAAATRADDGAVRGSMATLRDFLTQNVCLDSAGIVLQGVSPIDGDPRCVGQRDLSPGESLPYHKHDHPSPDQRAAAPTGYQRHDSVPVETAHFGVAIEQSFDFGAGQGRFFGVFDGLHGDGGDIDVLSPDAASIAATQDGGAGFQLFVGPGCEREIDAGAVENSWLIAAIDPTKPLEGHAVASLEDVKGGGRTACPARLDQAYTAWRVAPFVYRAGSGQGRPITLTTLISEHFGGPDPASAAHAERFYYTRELGSTRWERWDSVADPKADEANVRARAAEFAQSRRCASAPPPAGNRSMLMVDCREWTSIVPAAGANGDPPGFLLKNLRGDVDIFALAPERRH